ncbi:gliding motility-associated C-terminal domain-containing protein [Hymenobacter sp. BRD128]|uniref:T9SS type B sorting domain-containing protein n=1 Tax=Hymenobacter sp. BRD128 TaxID=2675878 RepID=UPI0020B83659|nr:gliding motility-associated C-terminal domain-containing protein [Hymenobacter sp. BRD128]
MFLLLLGHLGPALAQNRWARQAGGGAQLEQLNGLARDGSGNAYVVGFFTSSARFGGLTLNKVNASGPGNPSGLSAFIAKYDAQGAVLWAQATPAMYFSRVATDADGNVYALGDFSGSGVFGSVTLTSQGTQDMVLVKYNPQGQLLWVRQGGSAPGSKFVSMGLALDAAANAYVTGYLSGQGNLGTGPVASESSENVFLAKFNSQGSPQWLRQGGGKGGYSRASAVALDAAGNLYLAGSFGLTATFGTTTLQAQNGTQQILLAKCSPAGDFLWAKSEGGPGTATALDLAVDNQGNSFTTGQLGGVPGQPAVFGTAVFQVAGFAGFLVKHDPNGQVLWASQIGATNTNYGTSVALDQAGNSYVAGVFSSTLTTWGSGLQLTVSGGKKNIFVAKYDPQGRALRVQREGACGSAYGPQIAVTASQDIYLAGTFAETASFVSTLFASTNGQLFVARLGDLTTPSTPDSFSCATAPTSAPAPVPVPAPTPTPAPKPTPPPAPIELSVPNIITPNGDGQNDQLKIAGLVNMEWALVVYNRWGQEVYRSLAYAQDWTAPGLPAGTYYYRLWQPTGGRAYTGWLEVVR